MDGYLDLRNELTASDVRLAVSYVRSGVISWLVGMEEARLGSPFRLNVIDKLQDQDDPS